MKRLFSERLLSTRVSSYYIPDVLASFTPINFVPPGVKWYIILRKSVNIISFDVLRQVIIKKILSNSPEYQHGIKIILESGIIGRVKEIK